MDKLTAKNVLETFCSYPLSSVEAVFDKFRELPGAVYHFDGEKRNFIYVPGKREDRVLLVAHADTVWDDLYNRRHYDQELTEDGGVYMGKNAQCGIGADDRAGCAILWLLQNSGHSLLIVDGEEFGQIGSHHIKDAYPELFDELNGHCYMVQFDRRENRNYKVYNLPVSDEFIDFIEDTTGYYNAGRASRTDIIVLCRDICGVNLSIGYYNEHTGMEKVVFDEWYSTLELAENFLAKKQKRYPLDI